MRVTNIMTRKILEGIKYRIWLFMSLDNGLTWKFVSSWDEGNLKRTVIHPERIK